MGASASSVDDVGDAAPSKPLQNFRSLARYVGFLGSRRPISPADAAPEDEVIVYRFSKDESRKIDALTDDVEKEAEIESNKNGQNGKKANENHDNNNNINNNNNNNAGNGKKGIRQKFFDARAKRMARAEKRAPEEKRRGAGGVVIVDHASSMRNDDENLGENGREG